MAGSENVSINHQVGSHDQSGVVDASSMFSK
jgi:hypothetical protein